MFVLMSLIFNCLWCSLAPTRGMDRTSVPVPRVQGAAPRVATPQPIPLAFIHAPTLRLFH